MIDDISLDKYTFIRDAYLQRRRSLVFDGDVPETPAAPDEPASAAAGAAAATSLPPAAAASARRRRRSAPSRAGLGAAVTALDAVAPVNPDRRSRVSRRAPPFSEQGS